MNKRNEKSLPPELTRANFESDEEYQEYLDIEASDHEPLIMSGQRRKELTEAARNTIKSVSGQKVPVSIRLPRRDIQRAKSLALQQGMPYQTLISSIIHQFLDSDLSTRDKVEK